MFFKLDKIIDWTKDRDSREAYIKGFMEEFGFTKLGSGRMRTVYLSPNKRFVLKFPHHQSGVSGNIEEARRYSKFKSNPDHSNYGAFYAPCRLIQKTILMMRAVVITYGDSSGCNDAIKSGMLESFPPEELEEAPKWVQHMDCNQAGYLRNGRLVAYDFTETY